MHQAQPVAIVPAVTTQMPSAHPLPASTLSVAAIDPAPAKATPIVVPATIRSPSDSVTHAELAPGAIATSSVLAPTVQEATSTAQ
jgi:hypothetical protein